jgi:hypothetical protein
MGGFNRIGQGIGLISFILSLCSSVARAEDGITMHGAARTVSLFAAISSTCSKYMKVNTAVVEKTISAYLEAGQGTRGAPFNESVRAETTRRAAEVHITGERSWCETQRSRLRQLKLSAGIFDEPNRLETDALDKRLASLVLVTVLRRACSNHVHVNQKLAMRLEGEFRKMGRDAYGRETFDAHAYSAIEFKVLEVSKAGERTWCLDQSIFHKGHHHIDYRNDRAQAGTSCEGPEAHQSDRASGIQRWPEGKDASPAEAQIQAR